MKIIIFFFIISLTICKADAQNTESADTLELSRSLMNDKKFVEADKILSSYNLHHTDVNTLRLHAQLLYWMKDFNRSSKVFEQTLSYFEFIPEVKLDYGRFLFEMKKYNASRKLLTEFLVTDSLHAEANIILAYMALWNGRLQEAEKRATLIAKQYPSNKEAADIFYLIKQYTTPYMSAGVNFESDDQPRTGNSIEIQGGVYRSWLFSPVISAQFSQFKAMDTSYQTGWWQVTNKMNPVTGLTITLGAGIFEHPNKNVEFTGKALLSQKLGKFFSIDAGYDKRPYLYSLASLRKPVIEKFSALSLNFNSHDKWLGKAAIETQSFDDNNRIFTSYAWCLVPLINTHVFYLKGGYAFSFANAEKNNFMSARPLVEVVNYTSINGAVQGIYDPYFTPQNQFIHSLLASVKILFTKHIQFSSRTGIGVSAKVDNPGLVLEKNPGNQLAINKYYYYKTNYTPVEWASSLDFNLSSNWTVSAQYNYNKLLYYTRHLGGIQVKYQFY